MKRIALPAEGAVDLGRRWISVAAAMALLGGASVTLTSCSSGSSPAGPTPPAPPTPSPVACPADAVCGQVSTDPRHSAVIQGAQLAAGGALVLDIRGTQTHSHYVQLSADEMAAIRARQRVEKTSSLTLNHVHTVTFN